MLKLIKNTVLKPGDMVRISSRLHDALPFPTEFKAEREYLVHGLEDNSLAITEGEETATLVFPDGCMSEWCDVFVRVKIDEELLPAGAA